MRHSVNTLIAPRHYPTFLDLQHSHDPRHISSLLAPYLIDDHLSPLAPSMASA